MQCHLTGTFQSPDFLMKINWTFWIAAPNCWRWFWKSLLAPTQNIPQLMEPMEALWINHLPTTSSKIVWCGIRTRSSQKPVDMAIQRELRKTVVRLTPSTQENWQCQLGCRACFERIFPPIVQAILAWKLSGDQKTKAWPCSANASLCFTRNSACAQAYS